ncbi:MAG TPA: hypothetical protein VM532_15830 [Burkholderiales bacterium]|nr:hypothetical protein [Burkholderiales bacterium]
MSKLNLNLLALAVSLAFSTGASAENMSTIDYKAGKDKIAAEYKLAKAGCASLSGNPNDICIVEAKGKEKVATAELDANYKHTRRSQYQARVAKADADYAVAKERCDDVAGNAKDVCVKEAKAVETAAKANATTQLRTAVANATAQDTSVNAHIKANNQAAEARKDATVEKLDAEYKVAKEKCDTYAGSAKDQCLGEAKTRFGKS